MVEAAAVISPFKGNTRPSATTVAEPATLLGLSVVQVNKENEMCVCMCAYLCLV